MKRLVIGVVVLFGLTIGLICHAADFNGNGTGDIAIFRESSGLWSVRGITRTYFGETGESPVPGDYDGSGTDSPAIFRAASGLWAVRGVTRAYYGGASDEAKPGDYNGDRVCDVGIFRAGSGLWAVRGITRAYYGSSSDFSISPGTAKSPTRAIDESATSQIAGYYSAFNLATINPDLATGNIKSGATIFGVAGDSNVVDTSSGDATTGDILASKKAYVGGSEITGTMATWTLSSDNENVEAGYYNATTLSKVDSDLATGNIKDGVTIFGISGTYTDMALPKTGQFISYTDYDDGYYSNPAGTDIGNPQGLSIWSAYTADGGRFSLQTISGDVVVTDNATGLIWASDGNEAGGFNGQTANWYDAITHCNNLTFAGHSDWRLPNYLELVSILDLSTTTPSIDTNFFPNTHSGYYWSSTTYAGGTFMAWYVSFLDGDVYADSKWGFAIYVRAVRGGE